MDPRVLLVRIALLLLAIGSLPACIRSHALKPEGAWKAPRASNAAEEPMLFSVTDRTYFFHGKLTDRSKKLHEMFEQLGGKPWVDPDTSKRVNVSGWQKLRKSFSAGEREEEAMKPPVQGLYLRAHNIRINTSQGARDWATVAMITLYILPAYVGSGGFSTEIDVFRDGKKLKSYQYRVVRKAFFWLPLIVAAWVNAFTTSESDALEAIVRDVMADMARNNYFRDP